MIHLVASERREKGRVPPREAKQRFSSEKNLLRRLFPSAVESVIIFLPPPPPPRKMFKSSNIYTKLEKETLSPSSRPHSNFSTPPPPPPAFQTRS